MIRLACRGMRVAFVCLLPAGCLEAPPRPPSIDAAPIDAVPIDAAPIDAAPIDSTPIDAAACSQPDAASGALTCLGGRPGDLDPGGVSGQNIVVVPGADRRVGLATGSTMGYWDSPIFDGCAERTWRRMAWLPVRPSLKALPNGHTLEDGYPEGEADMRQNGLLLHFDEIAQPFADASGYAHTTSCFSDCPAADGAGAFAGAQKFTRTSPTEGDAVRVDVNDAGDANLEPAGAVTVEAWIRVDAAPPMGERGMVVTKGRGFSGQFTSYSIEVSPAHGTPANLDYMTIRCYMTLVPVGGGAVEEQIIDGTLAVPLGEWTHVACTYDGSEVIQYVNGVENTFTILYEGTIDYALAGGDDDVFVGSFGTGAASQHFDGAIDELAVHTRALTQEELQAHYLRRALRVKLQLRSCDDAACAGDAFVGPNGGDMGVETFFTEPCGTMPGAPGFDPNGLDCDRDSFDDAPGGVAIGPGRWAQARVFLERDDIPISPMLEQIGLCY